MFVVDTGSSLKSIQLWRWAKEGRFPLQNIWQTALKGSQSVVPASAPSGNFLEMQILEHHCRPTESETQGVEPTTLWRTVTWTIVLDALVSVQVRYENKL